MALTIDFNFIDTNKYITKWSTSTSSHADVNLTDVERLWNLGDKTIITNRQAKVSTVSFDDCYRLQRFITANLDTWDKSNAKLYMMNPQESSFYEYDTSETMGFTSLKKVTINLASSVWKGKTPTAQTGTVYVIVDFDSGLPASKYTVTTNLSNITFDSAITEIEQNSNFTFSFLADTGYQIDTLTSNIGTVTITDDKLTARIVGTATENIIITGTASLLPVKKSVSFQLTNMVCDNPVSEITENEDFNFTFTANTGNEITNLISNIGTVTINEDKQNASVSGTATTDITITGIATQVKTVYTITYALDNMTCVSPIYNIEENTQFSLYFVPATGYLIDELASTLGTILISDDKTHATIEGVATNNIIITGKAILKTNHVYISGELNNCVCSYSNYEVISQTKPCEIVANENYVFPTQIIYTYSTIIDGTKIIKYGSVYTDGKRIEFPFTFDDTIYDIYLDNVYTAEKISDKITDFSNIYYMTSDSIKDLAKIRFISVSDGTNVSYIDLGQFIVNLYTLPIGVPINLITSYSNIKLGYKNTSLNVPTINGDVWTYDLGTINLPSVYNNSYDTKNTEIYLNVPFFSRIELPSYLIGYSISIQFIFDVYTGNVTLTVNDTFTNSNIITQNQRIVTDLPYVQVGMSNVFNKLSNTNVFPLINQCFVEVIRDEPYPLENTFGNDVNQIVTIGDCKGYNKFSECSITSTIATNNEIENITRILSEGVIIN